MNWISFRGVSSERFGMRVEKMPAVPLPARVYQNVALPGKSGGIMIDGGRYGDVEICVTLNAYGSQTPVSEINAWLCGRGDLILCDMSEFKYAATVLKSPVVTRRRLPNGKSYDSFAVRFVCEPFRYEAVPDVLTLPGATTIGGAGTVDAEPEIVVDGTGDCTLTVGSTVLTLTGLTGSITIDCARKIAYSGGTSLSHLVEGEWPKLSVNGTAVSWTGNVTSVTVTPNWRWL